MRLEKDTLTFHIDTAAEAEEARRLAEDIMFIGKTHPLPIWVEQWLEAAGSKVHNRLMYLSMVLPQRLLISVLRYNDTLRYLLGRLDRGQDGRL